MNACVYVLTLIAASSRLRAKAGLADITTVGRLLSEAAARTRVTEGGVGVAVCAECAHGGKIGTLARCPGSGEGGQSFKPR